MLLITFVFVVASCTTPSNVEYETNSVVPLGVVEDLQYSETDSLSIAKCQDRLVQFSPSSSVKQGAFIPQDFVIFIDLDEVYMTWKNLPLTPLCVDRNYGLFRTIGVFEVPNQGELWSIDMSG